MYTTVLALHSWLRWAVVLIGLIAIVRALAAGAGRRPWLPLDDRLGLFFIIVLDVQLLLGLVLYFVLSPITQAALADFGSVMQVSSMRYWAVEHVFGMVVGVFLAHRGRARVKAASDPTRKHRVAAVFLILAMIAILASIPWPGMPNGRPLFR